MTFYTVFVIDLQSRRVEVVGCTRYPNEAFVVQAMRHLTDGIEGVLRPGCVLICDRDPKWSRAVVGFLEREGVRVIRTPARAPNCNAYAERFVRTARSECLDWLLILNQHHLERSLEVFVTHYNGHRPHRALSLLPPEPRRAQRRAAWLVSSVAIVLVV